MIALNRDEKVIKIESKINRSFEIVEFCRHGKTEHFLLALFNRDVKFTTNKNKVFARLYEIVLFGKSYRPNMITTTANTRKKLIKTAINLIEVSNNRNNLTK